MRPDERTFRSHIDAGPFQAGVDRDDWRCVSIEWPHAVVAIGAAARPAGPAEFGLRFELSDYPQRLPTSRPWDLRTNEPLLPDFWPVGDQASEVFNPAWNDGALYIPCDRIALEGHDAWINQYPGHLWDPSRDITHYLRVVRDVLNGPGYAGIRQQAA